MRYLVRHNFIYRVLAHVEFICGKWPVVLAFGGGDEYLVGQTLKLVDGGYRRLQTQRICADFNVLDTS